MDPLQIVGGYMRLLRLVLLSMLFSTMDALAQQPTVLPKLGPNDFNGSYHNSIRAVADRLCNVGAVTSRRDPVGALIAEIALREFFTFGGHRIDAQGRLFSFGVVESEQLEGKLGKESQLGHLGWWNVMRYWRSLSRSDDLTRAEHLEINSFDKATESADATNPLKREIFSVPRVLKYLKTVPVPDTTVREIFGIAEATPVTPQALDEMRSRVREAMMESVLRAAAADVPWSAAFISSVVRRAIDQAAWRDGAKRQFAYASAHRVYISEGFAAFKSEAGKQLFQACPLDQAMPNLGDLLCYARNYEPISGTGKDKRSDRIWWDHYIKDKAATDTHCDVVVHLEHDRVDPNKLNFVYVVGGNVHQAVSIKKLVVDGTRLPNGKSFRNVLFDRQPPKECSEADEMKSWTAISPPTGTAAAPQLKNLKQNCSLNDKHWFVLLQVRDRKDTGRPERRISQAEVGD